MQWVVVGGGQYAVGSCSCCRWWAVGWVVVAVVGGGQYVVGSCRWWAVCSG